MKFRPFRRRSDSTPGEDSFMDVVANLVGVLLILVVIVGANAGSQIEQLAIEQVDVGELQELQSSVQSSQDSATELLQNNRDLENKINLERELADQRHQERQSLLVRIETARRELESRKSLLSTEQQELLANSGRISSLEHQLAESRNMVQSLSSEANRHETIEHFPTPIAKTVFSDELHFRLREGCLVHVPMAELVELMKNEWQENALKLEVSDETLETVGPIGDFRLQYHLQAEEIVTQTSLGEMSRRTPRFNRFVLIPTGESIGFPLEQALTDGSDFRNIIDLASPEKTTVSIWVYPDSFSEFNQLKRWLYQRGYMTACWPLSANSPISGGPSGYRSTAQ